MNIADIIELGVASYSILIAGATFLLGFYLSEKARGTPSNRLGLYKFTILSIVIPSVALILPIILIVLDTRDPYWTLLVSFLIVLLVPPVALLGVLIKSWD